MSLWPTNHSMRGEPPHLEGPSDAPGRLTSYPTSGKVQLTISMIDIDCHRSGNPESAKAFADWLSDNYFPCLYHEPSTNGKGRHGYIVLFKEGFGDVAVANILKRLEKTLKKLLQVFLATYPEYQVENVEIKGTPHVVTWVKGEKRKIETMKSGALAKLPRDILTRFGTVKK